MSKRAARWRRSPMTPCAPFLPAMMTRARGDMRYAAAMMLIASLGTVALLPLAVPLVMRGLTIDARTVARPLIILVLAPLAIGLAVFRFAPRRAEVIRSPVGKLTTLATLAALGLCAVLHGRGFADAVGTFAIFAQAMFFAGVTVAAVVFSTGLPQGQRSAQALGTCTRNVGAAMSPLFTAVDIDQLALVMVVLGVPMQIVFARIAAQWFARRSSAAPGSDPADKQLGRLT